MTETAHWLEWQEWANPILQQPYQVKAGELHIPDVPGVGLEWTRRWSPFTWLTTSRSRSLNSFTPWVQVPPGLGTKRGNRCTRKAKWLRIWACRYQAIRSA